MQWIGVPRGHKLILLTVIVRPYDVQNIDDLGDLVKLVIMFDENRNLPLAFPTVGHDIILAVQHRLSAFDTDKRSDGGTFTTENKICRREAF